MTWGCALYSAWADGVVTRAATVILIVAMAVRLGRWDAVGAGGGSVNGGLYLYSK